MINDQINWDNKKELELKLVQLTEEHGDLDTAIQALTASPHADQLQIKRMKKKKLALKDLITTIEDYLTPDIIA